MLELVFPYLLSIVITVIVLFVAIVSFIRFQRAAANYLELENKLPDACRYSDLRERVQDAEQEVALLREEIFNARALLDEKERAEQWLNENSQQLLSVEAERQQQEHVRAELQGLLEKNAQETERHLQLAQQLKASELQLEAIAERKKEFIEQLQLLKKKHDAIYSEVQSLETRKAALDKDVASAESLHNNLRDEIVEAKNQLARTREQCKGELADLRRSQEEAQAKLHHIEEQIESAKRQLENVRDVADQVAGEKRMLEKEIQGLHMESNSLKTQADKYRKDWEMMFGRVGGDAAGDGHRTVELWKPVFINTGLKLQDDVKEHDKLHDVEQYLDGAGLRFHQRVIRAFHTSLKIADVSPLVVLAGISGTGKSELPRRYAEGMGLNFLNMAVQPRWDSPQDMFGFFNYLENRYRATELGRALVQMDRFHQEKGRGWNPPKDWEQNSLHQQMLLVLLDEMNLARVEYYFSEFLSRLEIRRGVNTDVPQERRKAELALEIGSTVGKSPTMHVFVDTNVLFVGTMNEDETTQSLSDKVVDRANVLRFGRPKELVHSLGNGQAQLFNQRLAWKAWKSWQRSEEVFDKEHGAQVDDWIAKLNNAMTHVKRPFAHRTSVAIRRYIANYPQVDNQWLENAMSDQVEQKILPKFRGLDPTETVVRRSLNEVRNVLRELDDEILLRAIDQTTSEHQFVWMGVDRFEQ